MEQMDSTQNSEGQNANSVISGGAVQPNSFDPEKFAKTLKADILAALSDDKQIQSLKDRTVASIKKDKGLREVFGELKEMQAKGLTEKEIEQEIRIRELETRLSGSSVSSVQSPGKVVEQAASNPVRDIISALGLDENNPEVTGILQGGDFTEQVSQLAVLAQRKKSNASNPALVAQPTGGGPSPVNPAQLEAAYKKEVMSNRGNRAAIQAIQKKYEEQGLDTWAVPFSV